MGDKIRVLADEIFKDGVYRDGNSVSVGTTYQPMPFDD